MAGRLLFWDTFLSSSKKMLEIYYLKQNTSASLYILPFNYMYHVHMKSLNRDNHSVGYPSLYGIPNVNCSVHKMSLIGHYPTPIQLGSHFTSLLSILMPFFRQNSQWANVCGKWVGTLVTCNLLIPWQPVLLQEKHNVWIMFPGSACILCERNSRDSNLWDHGQC